ncbi:hypothetical protein V9L13_13550 [Pseudomonas sp. RSB 5.4]|uniref:hypothetical protein n=1 Tax=Pseudomonas sp. RSB 5.4 TaxID=3127459 RepID=UPI0030CAB380
MLLAFFTFVVMAVFGLVALRGWPWSVESKIDFAAIATFLAVVVALGVAIRDSVIRWLDRRHQTARFVAYNRPAIELILKRVATASGVIEQKKGLRLGASRPHDSFKFASLVVHKGIWVDPGFLLETLAWLPVGQAKKVSYSLGLLPLLKSDFEALAATKENVFINERDQDLIRSIISRSKIIIGSLQEYLGLSEADLDKLIIEYAEVVYHDGEVYLVNGTA